MNIFNKYFGRKQQPPKSEDLELRSKCDEALSSADLGWAMPYLNAKAQLDEEARKSENSRQREKRILAAQQARKERRAPLFEVMAVPEDERSDSENEWVKGHFEMMRGWRHMSVREED